MTTWACIYEAGTISHKGFRRTGQKVRLLSSKSNVLCQAGWKRFWCIMYILWFCFFICYWHPRLVSQIKCERFCTSKTFVRLLNIQCGKSILQLSIISSGACVGQQCWCQSKRRQSWRTHWEWSIQCWSRCQMLFLFWTKT